MKLVATGDWHVYNFADFSHSVVVLWDVESLRYREVDESHSEYQYAKEMSSRLLNILNGLCDMRDYCIKNSISDVLMAGDCFHKRGTIEVSVFNNMYKILDSFHTCDITVHMIAGNHDDVDSSIIPTTSIHAFREIAHVIESPELFTIGESEIVAIPYSKEKKFVLGSILDLHNQCERKDHSILMCHLGVTGGKVGSGMYSMKDEYTLGDLMSNKFKYVVCGHYHQPQLLDHNSIYTGTPVQNSFGDELKGKDGYNGFFVLDTEKRYDIQFVPVIAPRFITCNSLKDLNKLDAEFVKRNYVRVKSSSRDVDDIQVALEELLGDDTSDVRLELEKEYVTEQRSKIDVSQPFEETVRIYAKERCVDGANLEKFTGIGLDILSEATVGGKI